MVYTRSVLTAVIAVGVASSTLAIPLQSSDNLSGTVASSSSMPQSASMPTTELNARDLIAEETEELRMPPVPYQHLGEEYRPNRNLAIEVMVPAPTPMDVVPDFEGSMELHYPRPMDKLPMVEDKTLTLALDVAKSSVGYPPPRIERRADSMTVKKAIEFLNGCHPTVVQTYSLTLSKFLEKNPGAKAKWKSGDWDAFQEECKTFIAKETETYNRFKEMLYSLWVFYEYKGSHKLSYELSHELSQVVGETLNPVLLLPRNIPTLNHW
ncbi:hypothetical protein J3R30DRAFT_3702364 [Lentinula aciculospora]|uniref:RxLR effector candidate protein n=1 Tax=Lentinula aciculospora TaxID=153920 RepID=A0A9W9DPT7_9AGAR|nr:hypothetical protein J3R30DRAFT_3702364 [Lentinula aciculospora]